MRSSSALDQLAVALRDVLNDDPAEHPQARLTRHGFSVLSVPYVTSEGFLLSVVLLHDSGQWLGGIVPQDDDTEKVRREFAETLLGKPDPSPFVDEPAQPKEGVTPDFRAAADVEARTPITGGAAGIQGQQPEKTQLEKIRAAYQIALKDHCGPFSSDEFRRGVEAALIGALEPLPHPRGWDVGHYRSALEDLEKHLHTGCPGQQLCTLRDTAAGRFFTPTEEEPAAAPDGPPSPSPTGTGNVTAGGVRGVSGPAGGNGETPNGGGAGIFCASCARAMTSLQRNGSQRQFGLDLCPACLKGHQPVTA